MVLGVMAARWQWPWWPWWQQQATRRHQGVCGSGGGVCEQIGASLAWSGGAAETEAGRGPTSSLPWCRSLAPPLTASSRRRLEASGDGLSHKRKRATFGDVNDMRCRAWV